MKFGFRTQTFYKWGMDRVCKTLADAGYDGIDISLEHPDTNPILLSDPKKGAEIRKILCDTGLELIAVSYHMSCDVPTISHTMDIAVQLGTNLVITNGDPVPLAGAKAQWPHTVERVKRLCEIAEDKGVFLGIEPDFVPGFVVASSAEFEHLAQEVDSPYLKINFDINHAVKTDDDYLVSLHRLRRFLAGVHLSDSRNRVHEHLMPGQGKLDWQKLKATLDEIGYAGYYVIDLFEDYDTPDILARESLLALKHLWRSDFAPSSLPP